MSKLYPTLWGFSCLQYLWLGALRIFLSYMKSYYNEFISPWWDISFPLLIGIYRKAISPIFCYIWEFVFPSIKEVISYPNISVDFYNLFFSQRWCFYYLFLPSMVVLLISHHSGIFFFTTSALTPTIEGVPLSRFYSIKKKYSVFRVKITSRVHPNAKKLLFVQWWFTLTGSRKRFYEFFLYMNSIYIVYLHPFLTFSFFRIEGKFKMDFDLENKVKYKPNIQFVKKYIYLFLAFNVKQTY